MRKKVLFFGPYPPIITGQSIAFKQVYDNYSGSKCLCDISKYNGRVSNTFYAIYFCFIKFLFSRKVGRVYFTCSRTKFGFIRDFVLLLVSRLKGVKVVNHLHGTDFLDFLDSMGRFKWIVKWSYKTVETSIVLIDGMQEQFRDFPSMKIVVVENCYGEDFADLAIPPKKNQFVYLSNIIRSKGILEFMEAVRPVLRSNPDWTVKIAGKIIDTNIEFKSHFQNALASLRDEFGNKVEFLDGVYGSEKITLLLESKVFVLPTYYPTEAFPISIVEAMRCGLAIVATKFKFLPRIVKDKENGLLVDVKSIDDLTDKLLKVVSNEEFLHEMGSRNIQEALNKYDPVYFSNKVNSIIDS